MLQPRIELGPKRWQRSILPLNYCSLDKHSWLSLPLSELLPLRRKILQHKTNPGNPSQNLNYLVFLLWIFPSLLGITVKFPVVICVGGKNFCLNCKYNKHLIFIKNHYSSNYQIFLMIFCSSSTVCFTSSGHFSLSKVLIFRILENETDFFYFGSRLFSFSNRILLSFAIFL